MKPLCLIHKSIRKQSKFTEHEYHKHRPRKALFSELVYFVQISPVFAGPVTNAVERLNLASKALQAISMTHAMVDVYRMHKVVVMEYQAAPKRISTTYTETGKLHHIAAISLECCHK